MLNRVSSHIDVDVLIPVYGNLDLVDRCLCSLSRLDVTDMTVRTTVLNDGMDQRESSALRFLAQKYSTKVLEEPRNLGFRRVVNRGFARMDADWVLLLNSDVELPPWALESLVSAGGSDPKIALVSPLATSGPPLSIELEPGQNWYALASDVRSRPREILDACTTVGYCLLIRKDYIEGPLFGEDLPDAYGEDTDLHFRLVERGYRAVVDTNCFVFHRGSASYSASTEHSELKRKAREHFSRTWQPRWEAEFPGFENELQRVVSVRNGVQLHSRLPEHHGVAFISPGHEFRRNGGLSVIQDLAMETCVHWPSTVIASLALGPRDEPPWVGDGIRALNYRRLGTADVVVATSPWTWNCATTVAHRKPGTRIVTLLQGMDYLLNPEHAHEMVEMIRASDLVITTSDYLHEFARRLGACHIVRLNIEPNPLTFVRRSETRDIDVLFSVRDTPLKGAELSAGFAALLSALGLSVAVIGNSQVEIAQSIERIPWPERPRLAETLSRARVFVDLSLTEGYGLQPREARLSDCSVIVLPSGGVLGDFAQDERVHVLQRPTDPCELLAAVENFMSVSGDVDRDIVTNLQSLAQRDTRFAPWFRWLTHQESLRQSDHLSFPVRRAPSSDVDSRETA